MYREHGRQVDVFRAYMCLGHTYRLFVFLSVDCTMGVGAAGDTYDVSPALWGHA